MKVLALDIGDKRTGLAIGTTDHKLSLPYGLIEEDDINKWCDKVKEVVDIEQIDMIVIGEPKTMSGGESQQTKKTKEWGATLKNYISKRIIFFDERLTSRLADQVLQSGTRSRDELAAMYLLQDFLNYYNLT